MKFTYYGHSCFSVEIQGKQILFDPFIKGNPLAKSVDINQIPADFIFVSHAHFDHIEDLLAIAQRTKATVISNIEIVGWCAKQGIGNIVPLNPGGKWTFQFGIVKCFAAVHSSSFANGDYGGVASGFVFQTQAGNFYYSGDTALTLDMQLIPKWAQLDFAVLPIGDDVTMGVDDAVEVALMIGVKNVIGVHYDTFEFIKIDRQAAINAFNSNKLTLKLLQIGVTVDI